MSSDFKDLRAENNEYVMKLLCTLGGLGYLVEIKDIKRIQDIMDDKDEFINYNMLKNCHSLIDNIKTYGLDNIDKLYIDLSKIDLDFNVRKELNANNIKEFNQLIRLFDGDVNKYIGILSSVVAAINNADDTPCITKCAGCMHDTLEERTCPDSYCKDCIRNSSRPDYYEPEIKKEDN